MRRMWSCVFMGLVLLASTEGSAAITDTPLYDVPLLDAVVIDGDGADWADKGFRVLLMPDTNGRVRPSADFDSQFRLGWDPDGLLVLVTVRDDVLAENDDDNQLWEGDSVELFVAVRRGSRPYYQCVASPGLADGHPELRTWHGDYRGKEKKPALAGEVARVRTPDGYVLEARLPWANLAIEPKLDRKAGFQIIVNDRDEAGREFQAVWFPGTQTYRNPSMIHRVRLAKKPSPPVRVRATAAYDDTARAKLTVMATNGLAGAKVRVKEGSRTRARGTLKTGVRPSTVFYMPMPPRGEDYGQLEVRVDGRTEATLDLPPVDKVRWRMMMTAQLESAPAVFQGTAFPPCDFAEPLVAEQVLGPYRIETTFYDKDYQVVTRAAEPGRYGAVLKVIPETGRPLRRFLTLYRRPDGGGLIDLFTYRSTATLTLPPSFQIPEQAIEAQSEAVSRLLMKRFNEAMQHDNRTAVLLAGLAETPADQEHVRLAEDFFAADRQWWVGLKRVLYGTGAQWPDPVVCPRPIEGAPAAVLREGSEAEASMKPGTVDAIDAVCQAWSDESNEPFGVCVARHGVAFFHKAYGQRDGEPMTLTTKTWMASISKFLSGTLMMICVDQGLVDLDDPIDKYLPALRDIPVETPLTIRHLYTHTNGLRLGVQPPGSYMDHWGDEMHDLEEIIADYYPQLEVGTRHGYNGVGYALGGKVIEAVSGEALPQFFVRHLWDPLDCPNTDAIDGSAQSMSVPLDMARFGQMFLNRGAYGDMRFFSEDTWLAMMPRPLTDLLGPDTKLKWGIGTVWMRDAGLGEFTFAHGAASSATLRIDANNGLVIVMTRNQGGPQHGKNHLRFIKAIVDGLDK